MLKFNTEEDLKQFLLENKEEIDGLFFCDNLTSEVTLGSYGRVDLLSWESSIEGEKLLIDINVYELKNVIPGYKELGQLCRYVSFFNSIKEKYSHRKDIIINIEGFLVTPLMERSSDFSFLYNQCVDNVTIIEFNINPLTGIEFNVISKTFYYDGVKNDLTIPEVITQLSGVIEDHVNGIENAEK